MYGRFGRGRRAGTAAGARGGLGFGFSGSSPPWPYVGTGRGGLPRCACFTGTPVGTVPVQGAMSVTREEELNFLKDQARTIQDNLERINFRVHELESQK
jgi:hypothetical protein